jgi:CheY-like chemotaxis protein
MISSADILLGRILIVDDLAVNVSLLEQMLRGAGYSSIESTRDPHWVVEMHRKNHYDLILLDLQMPDMDGFQVMDRLKEIEQDGYLPVLVLTAQPGHKLRALRAGAKDFVSKPFDLAEVLARVHNMLEVRLLHLETKRLYEQLLAEQKRSFELAAQPGAMVGVEKEVRLSTPWFQSLKLRLPWLHINLLTSFVIAAVVGLFQGTIDRLLILTIFMPVLTDQSNNAGSQALAITLRGMILGDLNKSGKEKAQVIKEALLGLLNGALIGLVAATGMYVVASVKHLPAARMLSLVVFLAMIGSCLISGLCGAIVPLVMKRFGANPVKASSIFMTTITSVVSIGLFLGLARLLVK